MAVQRGTQGCHQRPSCDSTVGVEWRLGPRPKGVHALALKALRQERVRGYPPVCPVRAERQGDTS